MRRLGAWLVAGCWILASPGFASTARPTAAGSTGGDPVCSDGIDNDVDGAIDFPDDPGCDGPFGTTESFPFACLDGADNDSDSAIDFPADLSCYASNDPSETAACADGIDNDGDGATDYPADPDCTSVTDETESALPECADRIDNDLDGDVDYPDDTGCHAVNDPQEGAPADVTVLKARALVILATSGSLHGDLCDGDFTGGDGSLECPGNDVSCATCPSPECGNSFADDSRLFAIKSALADLFLQTEVEMALLRGAARAVPFVCPDGSASAAAGGWQGSGPACSGELLGGELLVRFDDTSYPALAELVDFESNGAVPSLPPGTDFELRASGARALAAPLEAAATYLAEARASDPIAGCRPYRVLLLADGADACGGDAPAAAGALAAAGVAVEVVGIAAAPDTAALNAVAAGGGTGLARFVDSRAGLSAAFDDFVQRNGLVELCNGEDDDCDGEVDEAFPGIGGACDNGLLGACHRSGTRVCNPDQVSAACDAPPVTGSPETCNQIDDDCDGETDEGGVCSPTAELCNGLDDDGDGEFDEDFPVGLPCTDGGVGACRGWGTYVCDPQQTWVVCAIAQPGATPAPLDALCDGIDEDCDGLIDEEAVGEMVTIDAPAGGTFVIDRYEASRPDADTIAEGVVETRACSKAQALPWRSVPYATAAAACAAAGKRLCTEDEWQAACQGPQGWTYPYGNTFLPEACNGEALDPDCTVPDDDLPQPTGTPYGCPPPAQSLCASTADVLDLSGNLAEWTSSAASVTSRIVRGGAFDSQAPALTCQYGVALPQDAPGKPTLGFRCCADEIPLPTQIFQDGFETGDSSRWSQTVPP